MLMVFTTYWTPQWVSMDVNPSPQTWKFLLFKSIQLLQVVSILQLPRWKKLWRCQSWKLNPKSLKLVKGSYSRSHSLLIVPGSLWTVNCHVLLCGCSWCHVLLGWLFQYGSEILIFPKLQIYYSYNIWHDKFCPRDPITFWEW